MTPRRQTLQQFLRSLFADDGLATADVEQIRARRLFQERFGGGQGLAQVESAEQVGSFKLPHSGFDIFRGDGFRFPGKDLGTGAGREDGKGVVVLGTGQEMADDFHLRSGKQRIAVAGRLEQDDPVPRLPGRGGQVRPIAHHQVALTLVGHRGKAGAVVGGFAVVEVQGQVAIQSDEMLLGIQDQVGLVLAGLQQVAVRVAGPTQTGAVLDKGVERPVAHLLQAVARRETIRRAAVLHRQVLRVAEDQGFS